MISIIVILCVYIFFFIKTESLKCITNPLVYGVNKMTTSNGDEVTCSCSAKGVGESIIITKNGIYPSGKYDYNFSTLLH